MKSEFKKNVINEFAALKKHDNHLTLNAVNIPLSNGGYLSPIGDLHRNNDDLIENLKNWRNHHLDTYFNSPAATTSSTERWLNEVLIESESKVLFLLYSKESKCVGHIGLALSSVCEDYQIELDNLVRDPRTKSDGTFTDAIDTLHTWCKDVLLADTLFLRVLSTNEKAITFYEKKGFIAFSQSQLDENCYFLHMKRDSISNWREGEMILTAGPTIGSPERRYTADATLNGWNSNWSKYLSEYESKFAEYVGCKYAIATSSCSGALHIALASLELKPGDEVIVPDITWVATANAVVWAGGVPVFADVHRDTWDLDASSVEKLITNKTRAIIPVHLYGNPCRMDDFIKLKKKYNLFLIEDAAPSVGAKYKDKRTGSFGDFAAFSFQGAKLTVTGEGGMLCTNDKALYERAYRKWDQGRIPGTFWIEELGFKYKMSNIQAALGLGQLERVGVMIEKKRRINAWYREHLLNVVGIDFWDENEDTKSIYWMSCISLNSKSNITREELFVKLREKGIDTRPVFPSISQYPYWPKSQSAQPNSVEIANNGINLPSGVTLTKSQVIYVCDQIKSILTN